MSHRLLRVVGQPLHVFLMQQAGYFRLMRKHVLPPLVYVGVSLTDWCTGFGVKTCVLLPRRIVFFGAEKAPMVRTSDLSK
jgi:hypothetical protein